MCSMGNNNSVDVVVASNINNGFLETRPDFQTSY